MNNPPSQQRVFFTWQYQKLYYYCAFANHRHLIVRFASHSTKHSRHKRDSQLCLLHRRAICFQPVYCYAHLYTVYKHRAQSVFCWVHTVYYFYVVNSAVTHSSRAKHKLTSQTKSVALTRNQSIAWASREYHGGHSLPFALWTYSS